MNFKINEFNEIIETVYIFNHKEYKNYNYIKFEVIKLINVYISRCKTDEINNIIFSLTNNKNLNIENKNEYTKNLLTNMLMPNIINNLLLQNEQNIL